MKLLYSALSAIIVPSLGNLWDQVEPGSVAFFELGKCASGSPAYYGLVKPLNHDKTDELFVEMMGGAICFNSASCENSGLKQWTDIDWFLTQFMKIPADYVVLLKSGASVPLNLMLQLKSGYFPADASHPFWGKYGIYFPVCTADIFTGKHNASYEPSAEQLTDDRDHTCNETESGAGEDYRGCQNRTASGLRCQSWTGAKSGESGWDANATDGLGDHNFCRNPSRTGGGGRGTSNAPWCFVEDDYLSWDICKPVATLTSKTMMHHGGKNVADLLDMVKADGHNFTKISMLGASGGGVAAVAWSTVIADIWPEAEVFAVADSSLHVFPGTPLFDYFWEYSQYGHGPASCGVPKYDVKTPDFDWRETDAIAKHLQSYDGRVKVGYLSCLDDHVVYGDRKILATFAGLTDYMEELIDPDTQHDRTWAFLNSLHECAPDGTVFSYINNCDSHHQTRGGFPDSNHNPGQITPQTFINQLLKGELPDPNGTTQFWFEEHEASASDKSCPSAVRRRRSPTPEVEEEIDLCTTPTTSGDESDEQETSSAANRWPLNLICLMAFSKVFA